MAGWPLTRRGDQVSALLRRNRRGEALVVDDKYLAAYIFQLKSGRIAWVGPNFCAPGNSVHCAHISDAADVRQLREDDSDDLFYQVGEWGALRKLQPETSTREAARAYIEDSLNLELGE